jgi:hyperosmotically inducible periplasmic protein
MKMTKLLMAIAIITTVSFVSCSPKDADIQAAIETKIKAMPDMVTGATVAVKDGVATLGGECKDEMCKAACEKAATETKGVKSIVSNFTIMAPPAVVAPVVITADDPLTKAVADATKDYPGVTATVKDGVVSVTGEISKDKWKKLKMALDGLHPKKVDGTGLTIK